VVEAGPGKVVGWMVLLHAQMHGVSKLWVMMEKRWAMVVRSGRNGDEHRFRHQSFLLHAWGDVVLAGGLVGSDDSGQLTSMQNLT
jgi:hypothetical protein